MIMSVYLTLHKNIALCSELGIKNAKKEGKKKKTRKEKKGVDSSSKGLRLKEGDVEIGKEEDYYEGSPGSQQWGGGEDNGCVCFIFVSVTFCRKEELSAYFLASPSTQFTALIRSLIVCKTKKSS